ncbi:acyltransferase [Asanoa sp. NPDC049518]|uniref:acyltransferase n=1 Tax=unclassified Asanoa TaxID=2685164 RepID=UPI003441F2AC
METPSPRLLTRAGARTVWASSWAAGGSSPRLAWADAAKGVCIILVVLWHVVVKDYLLVDWHIGLPVPGVWGTLGEQLLPLRMPLFFTISGFFATGALVRPWRVVARGRIATFLYLYAVWLLVHTAVLALVPVSFPTERARSPLGLLTQLTITPSNLWYLYALALYFAFAKAVRRLPVAAVLVPAAVLSAAVSFLPTPGDRGGVYQNLVFFLAGLHFRPFVSRLAASATRRRLVLTGLAYAVALAVMAALGAQEWFGVWLVVSAVAVAFGVTAAARLVAARPTLGARLGRLGRITLPIYVIHMPVLAVLHGLLVGPLSSLGDGAQFLVAVGYPVVATLVVIVLSLGIHRGLTLVGARWMFALPSRRLGASA